MQLYCNFFLKAFPSYSQTTTIFDIHPTKKAVTRLKSFCFAHQCSFCIPLSKNKRVTSIFKYFCSEWNEAYFCYKSTLPASTLYTLRHSPLHLSLQSTGVANLCLTRPARTFQIYKFQIHSVYHTTTLELQCLY